MNKGNQTKYNELIKYLKLDKEYIRLCGTIPEKSHMADCEDGCNKCCLYSKKHTSFNDNEQMNLFLLISSLGISIKHNLYGYDISIGYKYINSINKDFGEALAEIALKLAANKLISKSKLKKVFTKC